MMSQKPAKAPTEDKQKRKRKRKSKQTLTRAVTHIRLLEANTGKLEALDALVTVYLELCQRYTTLFCQAECTPDKWGEPVFETELSDRLHRVAMQQAAGIARSFRSNRARAFRRLHLRLLAPNFDLRQEETHSGTRQTGVLS
jgi:hypothetical protein